MEFEADAQAALRSKCPSTAHGTPARRNAARTKTMTGGALPEQPHRNQETGGIFRKSDPAAGPTHGHRKNQGGKGRHPGNFPIFD